MDFSFQGRGQKQEVEIGGNHEVCLEGDELIVHTFSL
jgi:hypothetical protein